MPRNFHAIKYSYAIFFFDFLALVVSILLIVVFRQLVLQKKKHNKNKIETLQTVQSKQTFKRFIPRHVTSLAKKFRIGKRKYQEFTDDDEGRFDN